MRTVFFLAALLIIGPHFLNESLQAQEASMDYVKIQTVPSISEQENFVKFLGAEFSETRIVGLGEVVHGSGGLHQAMSEVGKGLIQNHGFRSIAIETPWIGVESLDQYFKECASGNSPSLPHLSVFPQFTTSELGTLYQWICEFNQTHGEDRVNAFGFDVQQLGVVPAHLHDEPQLRIQLDEIREVLAFPKDLKIDNCGRHVTNLSTYERCKNFLDQLTTTTSHNEQTIVNRKGKSFYVYLITRITSLRQWVEYTYQQTLQEYYASGTARDKGMAKVFERLDNFHGQKKTIILAHLGHIARNADYQENRFNPNYDNMGSALSAIYGETYKIVGFSAKDVVCEPVLCPEAPYNIPDEYHDYWSEKILHDAFSSHVLLNLKRSSHLQPDRPHFVGGGFGILKDNFDLLFFLQKSAAATHLGVIGTQ